MVLYKFKNIKNSPFRIANSSGYFSYKKGSMKNFIEEKRQCRSKMKINTSMYINTFQEVPKKEILVCEQGKNLTFALQYR